MTSFLQAHYDRYRQAGGDHSAYIVYNDIGADVAEKLKRNYDVENATIVARKPSAVSAVERIRQERVELKGLENRLIKEEKEAIRRSFIRCKNCNKSSRLLDWTFVQKTWWVPATGCNDGGYLKHSYTYLCDVVCPKCEIANYIYNHPQREKLVDLLGEHAWQAKELFKEVTIASH